MSRCAGPSMVGRSSEGMSGFLCSFGGVPNVFLCIQSVGVVVFSTDQ